MTTWFLGFDPAVKAAKTVDVEAISAKVVAALRQALNAYKQRQHDQAADALARAVGFAEPIIRMPETRGRLVGWRKDVMSERRWLLQSDMPGMGRMDAIADYREFLDAWRYEVGLLTQAKSTKAEYWVNPLKVRFAISQLEAVIPDEVNSPKTLQVIAQRCDDIVGKLPTRENPGMEDTAFALKKAAGEFRIASRLLNDPARFDASYTRAKQYVHAALIKVSGIPGAHRSAKADMDDPTMQRLIGMVRIYLPHVRTMQVNARTGAPIDAGYVRKIAAAFNSVVPQLADAETKQFVMDAIKHLQRAAAYYSSEDRKNAALHLSEAMAHLQNI